MSYSLTPPRPSWRRHASALAFLLAVVAATLAYWPGLAGDFLFDDYVNLNALGRYGGVRDLHSLLFYLLSGIADPTGRPVAMASFLIDARDWPADPFSFKRTNLLIHLGNGILLYSVLAALGHRFSQDLNRSRLAASVAAALWLLNPLWVSTVLYIVQRHAMLAMLFVMAGIRAWVASRNAFDRGNIRRGWWLAILAVPVFGVLAGLSKANGFLLPLFLAALELTVLGQAPFSFESARRRAASVFVWLPTALLLAILFWYAIDIGLDGNQGRPWTLAQRLMTQPRALCEYLWRLFVPGFGAAGVFGDGFAVSQSWFVPSTTILASVAIAIIAGATLLSRRRWPVLAAALGFFLVGHIMESSVVMLEIYFEHRNYLPAALLFWPLAWWLTAPCRLRRWLLAGVLGYASLMVLVTMAQSRLWGNPLDLALVWAEQNTHSARAQTHAFHQELTAGRLLAAEHRLSTLLEDTPLEPQFALNLLNLRCEQKRVTGADVDSAAAAIQASGGLILDVNYQWLSHTIIPGSGAACSSLSEEHIRALFNAATTGAQQSVALDAEGAARAQRLSGYFALRIQDCNAAQRAFSESTATLSRPELVQSHVVLLAKYCGSGNGLEYLQWYIDKGAPIASASTPILRLRDRAMKSWWTTYWDELQHTLEVEAGSSTMENRQSPKSTRTPSE